MFESYFFSWILNVLFFVEKTIFFYFNLRWNFLSCFWGTVVNMNKLDTEHLGLWFQLTSEDLKCCSNGYFQKSRDEKFNQRDFDDVTYNFIQSKTDHRCFYTFYVHTYKRVNVRKGKVKCVFVFVCECQFVFESVYLSVREIK